MNERGKKTQRPSIVINMLKMAERKIPIVKEYKANSWFGHILIYLEIGNHRNAIFRIMSDAKYVGKEKDLSTQTHRHTNTSAHICPKRFQLRIFSQ